MSIDRVHGLTPQKFKGVTIDTGERKRERGKVNTSSWHYKLIAYTFRLHRELSFTGLVQSSRVTMRTDGICTVQAVRNCIYLEKAKPHLIIKERNIGGILGRPIKEGLDFFPHDTDMSNNELIEKLEFRFKNDGYAVFNKILEKVFDNKSFSLSTEDDYKLYGNKWHVGSKKLKEIVNYSREIGLFPDKSFVSNAVHKRLKKINHDRKRKRNYYKTKTDIGIVSDVQNSGETPPLDDKAKQSKEKKSIDTKNHFFSNSPYYELELFKEKFYSVPKYRDIDAEFYYDAVKNWAESKGIKRIDWIATARGFVRKDQKDGKVIFKPANVIKLNAEGT